MCNIAVYLQIVVYFSIQQYAMLLYVFKIDVYLEIFDSSVFADCCTFQICAARKGSVYSDLRIIFFLTAKMGKLDKVTNSSLTLKYRACKN